MKRQHVYIITNPQYEKDNMYKIGYHTGTKKELEKRYHTSIVDLKIVRFTKSLEPKKDEKNLHELFEDYRKSGYEWFVVDKKNIIRKI